MKIEKYYTNLEVRSKIEDLIKFTVQLYFDTKGSRKEMMRILSGPISLLSDLNTGDSTDFNQYIFCQPKCKCRTYKNYIDIIFPEPSRRNDVPDNLSKIKMSQTHNQAYLLESHLFHHTVTSSEDSLLALCNNAVNSYLFNTQKLVSFYNIDIAENEFRKKLGALDNYSDIYDNKNLAKFLASKKIGLYRASQKGETRKHEVISDLLIINNDVKQLKKFFETYGFLFSIRDGSTTEFDTKTLFKIFNRLKCIFYIQEELWKKDLQLMNYDNLINCVLFLLLSENDQLTDTYSFWEYDTCHSSIWEMYMFETDDEINQNKYKSLEIPLNPYLGFSYNRSDYLSHNSKDKIDINEFVDRLIRISKKPSYLPNNYLIVIKFLLEYISRYGDDFSFIDRDNQIPYKQFKMDYDNDKHFMSIIADAAKIVIKDEFDFHLKDIKLHYSANSCIPVWNINSLLCAIYFSLAYYNNEYNEIRTCEFCEKKFFTERSGKKKYCSNECRERRNNLMKKVKKMLKEEMNNYKEQGDYDDLINTDSIEGEEKYIIEGEYNLLDDYEDAVDAIYTIEHDKLLSKLRKKEEENS